MLHAPVKIICQFHAHSVHQNSVEIFWAEVFLHLTISVDVIHHEKYVYSVSTVFRYVSVEKLWTQNTRIIHDVWRLLPEVVPDYCASDFLQI
jgi:hypothetical protein